MAKVMKHLFLCVLEVEADTDVEADERFEEVREVVECCLPDSSIHVASLFELEDDFKVADLFPIPPGMIELPLDPIPVEVDDDDVVDDDES